MVPSIAIVGGGPAGLTLARLLQLSPTPMSVTIYEHDACATARFYQGGTLDLHPNGGLKALQAMGLEEAAAPFLRYEGEELVIADPNGCELIHMKEAAGIGERAAAPEIDREKLKELLLDAVGQENLRWGMHLKRVQPETRCLEFADSTVEGPFDLVVGADGAWSKVRHVLTGERPHYSGICGVEGRIAQPNQDHPHISTLVGRGSYFSFGGGRSLMAQRMGDDSIRVGMWMKEHEGFVDDLSPGENIDENDLRSKVLAEFNYWTPELREWIQVCKLTRKWKLWELPVGSTWDHRAGFTLVGDAAHLCTPFAGLGVNAAMSDCLDLAELLIKAVQQGSSLDAAIQQYEKAMFPRAKKVQSDTMRNKVFGFADDAPLGILTAFAGAAGEEMGYPLDRGVLYFVPVSRLLYAAFWMQTRLYAAWLWAKSHLRRSKRVKLA